MGGFASSVMTRVYRRITINVIEPLIDLLLDFKEIGRQFKYRQRLIQLSLAIDQPVKSADKVAIIALLIDRLVTC